MSAQRVSVQKMKTHATVVISFILLFFAFLGESEGISGTFEPGRREMDNKVSFLSVFLSLVFFFLARE